MIKKQTPVYNTACIPIFLSIFILNLEEDYVELDDIVEDLNDLDEKSEDEQKPNKPETGKYISKPS